MFSFKIILICFSLELWPLSGKKVLLVYTFPIFNCACKVTHKICDFWHCLRLIFLCAQETNSRKNCGVQTEREFYRGGRYKNLIKNKR